jgi:uncharacterized repeat protein (TIGR01451 family)/LPXTG-motif cell wall-anchored protein
VLENMGEFTLQRTTRRNYAPVGSKTPGWSRGLRSTGGLIVGLLVASGILLTTPVAATAAVSPDEQWITDVSGRSNAPATLTFGDSGVTATMSATASRCGSTANEVDYATLISRDAQNYFSPQAPAVAGGVAECLNAGTSGNRVISLSKPITGLTLHINNLDASYIDLQQAAPGGYLFERVKSNATLQVQENGTRIRNTVNQGTAVCTDDATSANNPGCGSFRLSQNGGPVSTFGFTNLHAISGNDGWYWSLSFHKAALTKTFTPSVITAGSTSALAITITNPNTEGAIDLAGAGYTDTLPAGLKLADGEPTTSGCGSAVINQGEPAAGQTAVAVSNASIAAGSSCVVTVNVKADEAGTFVNNNANITTTLGNVVPNASATLTVNARSELSLAKHAAAPVDVNGNGITDVGDTILYTFDVSNTGQTALTGITVDDPKAGTVSCGTTALAAGAATTCSAETYTITSADVANGSVDNTATASGTNPQGGLVSSLPSKATTPAVASAPAVTLVKAVTTPAQPPSAPGDVVDYTFTITNTGNVPLKDVGVTEGTFTGSGSLSPVTCPGNTLALGQQLVCTAEYTLTQADVDAGTVSNVATAQGTGIGAAAPTLSSPSEAVVTIADSAAITITKTADVSSIRAAGDDVAYSFLVTNTGNVTLSEVSVTDSDFTGTGQLSAISCPTTVLAPGAQTTCTASYTATQADLDAGGVVSNSATAEGTTPAGEPLTSARSTIELTVVQAPALTLKKTADVVAVAVGQTITYSFLVTNTGNVTISDPTIMDADFTGTGELSPVSCPEQDTLAPGADLACTATYTVTQADVDSGALSNTATVTGTKPDGNRTGASAPSTVELETEPLPALSIVKTADRTSAEVGQSVTYSFVLTNTGNVTITHPTVTEGVFSGSGELSAVTCPNDATLAPGDAVTCTATYTVTRTDLTSGPLTNTATASGSTPSGDPIVSAPSTAVTAVVGAAVHETPQPVTPASLAKTGSSDSGAISMAAIGLLLVGGAFLTTRRRAAR